MSCDIAINAKDSKRLARKLKYEDPEQFQTLVRMHLSFVLDLNIDEADNNVEKGKFKLKWGFAPFTKKQRHTDKILDSTPLARDMISQVSQLVKFLMKDENLVEEGIFRRSGKLTRQQELKSLLSQGVELNLDKGQFSVHDCASVLKSFLAELPEPLLTEMYYPAYCQIAELCQEGKASSERMLHALQLVLLLTPTENRRVTKEVLRLLNLTDSFSSSNRMPAQNLATLFTPHLLCPRKLSPEAFHINAQNLSCVVVFMIKEGLEVFEVPPALATDIKAYWDRRRLTPNNMLEESVSEAKTVFSFVDRARSGADATEKALAQLYAHVQALPESSKKRRLVNKFNKENGQGTPRTKTIGDSIKHIFQKAQKSKSFNGTGQFRLLASSSGDELNSPEYERKSSGEEPFETIHLLEASLRPGRRRSVARAAAAASRAVAVAAAAGRVTVDAGGGGGQGVGEVGQEKEEEGSSPPKTPRLLLDEEVEADRCQGGDGNPKESEACRRSVWLESLPLGNNCLDDSGGVLVQRRKLEKQNSSGGGELGGGGERVLERGLQPDRGPELHQSARGLRPLVVVGAGGGGAGGARRRTTTLRRRPPIPAAWAPD